MTAGELRAQMERCESETSALAQEIVSTHTPARRRAEALIRRAAVQTRAVALEAQLRRLER